MLSAFAFWEITMRMIKILFILLILPIISGCMPQAYVRVDPILPPAATDSIPSSAAVTEAEVQEPPYEASRVRFVAAGDNVIHPSIYIDAAYRAKGQGHDFLPMYANVADFIASFDVAFINQETLLGGDSLGFSGYPRFNSPQKLAYDLKTLGFDVVNIANNHMADKGEEGLLGTIELWEREELSDVTLLGGYRDAEDAERIRITEHRGVKVAWLSFTEHTNGMRLPADSMLVVPYIGDADIIRQCAKAEDLADITVVSVHWGDENSPVNNNQRRLARLMCENGADVILGHHPHVLQPIEWIEANGNRTLCAYSLGNLVSSMANWENMVGGFLSFDVVKRSDGEVWVEDPAFTATAFYYGPNYLNTRLYFLGDISESLVENHGSGPIYGSYGKKSDMIALAKNAMGAYLRLAPQDGK